MAGSRCQVCTSPDLVAIHEQLLLGAPRRRVARVFGLSHDAMDRHWWKHMPAAMKAAAARATDERGPMSMQALDGEVLLGLAGEQYERSVALLDRLEDQMSVKGARVDARSIVAALREVRQSVETLGKLSFAVQDRPGKPEALEAPAIDAAIRRALETRDVIVTDDEPASSTPGAPRPVLELMPVPDTSDAVS